MRQLLAWVASTGAGFWRCCVVAAVTMTVPVIWAAAVYLAILWNSPWAMIVPCLWAAVATFLVARPICRVCRSLVERWTGTTIPPGYREPAPVTRMATGYWWNGTTYSRTSKGAIEDQELRNLWSDPATWRDLRFTAIAPATAGLVALVPVLGVAAAVVAVVAPGVPTALLGVFGLAVALAVAPHAWQPIGPVADRFLRGSPAMALADRVDELTAQRADTTVAQAAEIHRIERDLHDGAQARLVGLGMSLATAEKLMETDPERAKALLRDARAGASASLTELRELVRGIRPPVLNERGLVDAVRAFALDSPLEATVSTDLKLTLDPPIESALYFGVVELVTNAAKHAHANLARISIVREGGDISVEVVDDGKGGADVRGGGGLAGLQRRLAAFDGRVEITSPEGGPTRVRMMVPCE